MTKRTLSTLVFILTSFTTTPLLAERPAAEEEITTAVQNEELPAVTTEVNGRPAASDTIEVIEQSGDVMRMPTGQSDNPTAVSVRTLDFPRRGMTQDKVQNELGRPVEIIPAIGKPPITRWVYDDRVVYFEYSSVIHVVAK